MQNYLDRGYDLGAARQTQEGLVALYRDDIAKHAGDRSLQVRAIYDSLPAQLDKENRFKDFVRVFGPALCRLAIRPVTSNCLRASPKSRPWSRLT